MDKWTRVNVMEWLLVLEYEDPSMWGRLTARQRLGLHPA